MQAYERNLEQNLFELSERLLKGRYRHDTYVPFTIHDPKERRIHKSTVTDRVVHQALVSAIEPLFEPQFIYDSYSCRKGKGTHAAVARLRMFLQQASHNNTQTIYGLKCDVRQFFASVNHRVVLKLLGQRIQDEQTLGLVREVLNSYYVTPGKGVPLGNLTSQLFANIYLHELDWYVKNVLRVKHYLRYCDDFVILGETRGELYRLVEPIGQFLTERLGLQLHPHKLTVRSWSQGIDFLGYVLKPDCTVLRTKTTRRIMHRVNGHNLSSYLGLCSHADGYELGQVIRTVQTIRG